MFDQPSNYVQQPIHANIRHNIDTLFLVSYSVRKTEFHQKIIIIIINKQNSKSCIQFQAKLAKYHLLLNFLAKKHRFGNKWQSTTFLEYHILLNFLAKKHRFGNKWQSTTFLELDFLISFATVSLLRWKLAII